jgi:HEAT repeat protein
MRQENTNQWKTAAIVACFVLFCCAASAIAAPALLDKVPGQNSEERDRISAEAVKAGPDFILNDVLSASSTPVFDAKVQFLLSGVADYVSRPGAQKDRAAFAVALSNAVAEPAKYLKNGDEPSRKEDLAFLMSLLEMVGGPECVDVLNPYLSDDRLCDPAARALVTIGTQKASEALSKALASAADNRRVAIIQALGELRCGACVEAIAKDASSQDSNLQRTALFALANIGDPSSGATLAKAAQASTPHARAEATGLYLLYARRLAEAGRKKECEAVCRDLMGSRTEPSESNVRCAALSTLAGIEGKRALKDLLAAVETNDKELRGCALQLASKIPGKGVTKKWVQKTGSVDPEKRAEIIAMLGDRGDKTALAAVGPALKDGDKAVRLGALDAAAKLGCADALPQFLATLEAARDADEIEAVKGALLRVVDAQHAKRVAQALTRMSPPAKKALIEILAARRAKSEAEVVFAQTGDADQAVRVAAIAALANLAGEANMGRVVDLLLKAPAEAERSAAQKSVVALAKQIDDPEKRADAILARFDGSAPDKKAVLLAALAGVGGKRALEVVVRETASTDGPIREAAVRALADWPDATAIPELLTLARASKDETHQVLALRGGIRLIGSSDMSSADKVRLLQESMGLAKRGEEKTLVLGTLADIRAMDSFRMASGYLDDKALQTEAALAVAKIALPRNDKDKGLIGPEVVSVLNKAVGLIADAGMQKDVKEHIASIPVPDAEGFVPLFNGRDLTGWVGDTKGYVVENGAIVCKPGGNLYTEGEYGDFAVKFEFKLTPGANNGLGIRAPLNEDAAYAGMEIQILDDTSDQYKDLHPYQFHGSIYGVVPCERGHLKPVGEWNSEEVIAQGPHIIVKLNGATIVDADIEKASANGTMDGKAHPGLKNAKGHIGFLGHGTVVEFRNIRVKELK